MFNQVVGVTSSVDSQVIINSDKSYNTAEYGEKVFGNVTVAWVDGRFKVNAEMKGTGGLFKLFFNIQSSDPTAANENKDTGIYLDDISIKTEKEPEADPTEGEYKVLGADSISNAPYTGEIYGKLIVKVSDGTTHNNRSNWIWQYLMDTSGRIYRRRKVNQFAWSTWNKIADAW